MLFKVCYHQELLLGSDVASEMEMAASIAGQPLVSSHRGYICSWYHVVYTQYTIFLWHPKLSFRMNLYKKQANERV